MAMILAAAALLGYVDDPAVGRVSQEISSAVFDAVRDGVRTADLGGGASTTEFTDEVIRRIRGEEGRP